MALDTGGAAIVCRGVDVWAGNNPLILDVNWNIMPRERWAIQGTNGCGKSTLLRAIGAAALGEKLEDGVLQVSSSLRMGMLEQTAVSGSDLSVRDEVMSRMGAQKSLEVALAGARIGHGITESGSKMQEEEMELLERLVKEQEARLGDERPGQGRALLLATG